MTTLTYEQHRALVLLTAAGARGISEQEMVTAHGIAEYTIANLVRDGFVSITMACVRIADAGRDALAAS